MDHRHTDGLISTGYIAQRVGLTPEAIKRYDRAGRIRPSIRVLGSDRRVWRLSELPLLEQEIGELLRRSGRRGAQVA